MRKQMIRNGKVFKDLFWQRSWHLAILIPLTDVLLVFALNSHSLRKGKKNFRKYYIWEWLSSFAMVFCISFVVYLFICFHHKDQLLKCKNLLSRYVFSSFHKLTSHSVLKIHFAKTKRIESLFRTHLEWMQKKIVSLDQKPLNALFGLINPSQYFRVYNGIRVKSYVQRVLLDIMSNTKISKAHI